MAVLLQRGRHVAEIELAGSHAARRRGLLGRDGIDGAFLLEPCRSVHTIGMRFAIDVAYCRGSKADGLHVMCIHTMPIRRVGRPSFPVPSPAVNVVAKLFRRAGLVDFSPEQMRYLEHGRVADVSRLRGTLDWTPRSTTRAFDDFVTARASSRLLRSDAVALAEEHLLGLLARRRGATSKGAVGA